jgi:hypothetical protein
LIMYRNTFFRSFLAVISITLGACSASGSPQRIASYPKGQTGFPVSFVYDETIYNAYIVLNVTDTHWATDQAYGLAYRYGGYLVSSQSWEQEGDQYSILVMAVPPSQFAALYDDLASLGSVVEKRISSDYSSPAQANHAVYTQVVVKIRSRAHPFIPVLPLGWNPGYTLHQAFEVFLYIFGFLMDILIWLVVVAGPFVLIAWGVRWVLQRKNIPPK